MKCLNISLIMTATPAAGIQLTFHSIAIKCFHQITFQRLRSWFSHKTTQRMAANGNHREQGWHALVSTVIRAVFSCFFLTSLHQLNHLLQWLQHPALPWAVSRDVTPAQPAFPSFPITAGEIQGNDATYTAARSVPAHLDEQKPSEHLALSQQ